MSLVAFETNDRRFTLPGIAEIDAEGRRRQPLFWGAGLAFLALMPPTVVAFLLDDRLVHGINVWIKPLKFEVSLAAFFLTLAWLWGALVEDARSSRGLNRMAAVTVGCTAFEIGYIFLQSARGVGSHFNLATPIEGALFTLMGIAALTFTAMAPALGIAIARRPRPSIAPALRLAIVLGLILTFVLGAGAGIAISINNGHWVGAPSTDAGGFPIFGWTRQGGDLRVAHFIGIHAMQILPVAGWLIAARRPNGIPAVWLAAAGLTALTAYTLVEALGGMPFLAFL